MKKSLIIICVMLVVAVFSVFGQSSGDYRSAASGNWGDASSWEVFNGTTWDAAVTAPSGTSETITIQSGDTITVASGSPITINGASVVVNGYLMDVGVITPTSGTWTINNGATYEIAHAPATNTGLPTATWNTGSTCKIGSGITSSTTGLNGAQNFYNLIVDCPTWAGSLNLGWTTGTINIGGDVTVNNTGTGRWQWCAPTAGNSVTVNVSGNLTINGGADASNMVNVTSNGTSNGTTTITINIMGNVMVNGNASNNTWTNFSISRGSQGGTGTCTWNMYGNFTMTDATTQNSNSGLASGVPNGRFSFVKSGTQTISWSNINFASSNINMEVGTGSTLQLNSAILLNNGRLNLAGGKVVTTSTNLLTVGTGVVGGSSTSFVDGPLAHSIASTSSTARTFAVGKGSAYRPVVLTVTQDAATATSYTVEVFNTAPTSRTLPGSLDLVSSVRYYAVSKGAGANVTVGSIQLSYDTDDGVTDELDLRIAKDDGVGTWVDLGGTGTAVTTGTITSTTNFTSFSDFALANNTGGSNPLPVELTSFTVSTRGRSVELRWNTATEVNNNGFEIQRSEIRGQKSAWAKVGFVNGAGTSNSPKQYSYNDVSLTSGKYSYRLKQIDNDGKFSYSNEVEVNVGSVPKRLTLLQNYPNPFNPMTNLEFAVPENGKVMLRVFNMLGQEVAIVFNGVAEAGQMYVAPFNAGSLPSGIYFSVLEFSGKKLTQKMMLMK